MPSRMGMSTSSMGGGAGLDERGERMPENPGGLTLTFPDPWPAEPLCVDERECEAANSAIEGVGGGPKMSGRLKDEDEEGRPLSPPPCEVSPRRCLKPVRYVGSAAGDGAERLLSSSSAPSLTSTSDGAVVYDIPLLDEPAVLP